MTDQSHTPLFYRYTFLMAPQRTKTFELQLDASTLELHDTHTSDTCPWWTQLHCCQCPNCPLSAATHSHCPVAVNIQELVAFFTHITSYDQLDVEVATEERSYIKHTSASEAVSSLLGIYMVTSGCPIMDKLRPMVRFHLPLATPMETTFRAMAMYLVAQYFIHQHGGIPDWDLAGLRHTYSEVQEVNSSFARRLQDATDNDASVNALVRLDALASAVLMSTDSAHIQELEAMFAAWTRADVDPAGPTDQSRNPPFQR